MAALELKGIPGLPTTLFLVSALSAVAYRHMVLAFLESICLQLPGLLAQNGSASTCIAGGSLVLLLIAANRRGSESSDFSVYMRVLGPGHACLLLGRLLQRPKMPSLEGMSASSASWMLVNMLTWVSKPAKASPATSPFPDEPSCRQDANRIHCSSGGSAVASGEPAQPVSTGSDVQRATYSSRHGARQSRAGTQQHGSRAASVQKAAPHAASARSTAGDVHIVRPARPPLRRSASCPEEAAGQPPAGCRAAAGALRSHSLSPEAWEDLHGGVASSASLRSHSLELPGHLCDGVPSSRLTSHQISLEAGSNHGSFADLASLADAGGDCPVGAAAAGGSDSLARSASASSSVEDASFHDAVDAQATDAVSCLGMDGDCPAPVRAACPEAFLLQFGALLNESSAVEALQERGLPGAWGGEGACFGAPDNEHASGGVKWESICEEACSGVGYAAWRRPLRAGLYLYRTSAVIDGVAPADVRRFHLDDEARHEWDETLLDLERFPGGSQRENCIVSYRAKWPRPFSPREYVYGRRVWTRPADGGCYCVSASANGAAATAGRAVRVRDFASCLLIRAAPGRPGATEVTAIYFEDPCVRPGIMNLAVRKGLWPYLLKYVASLREHSAPPASPHSQLQSEQQGSGQAAKQRAGHNRRNNESSQRRSMARPRNRHQPGGLKRLPGSGLFRRRSLLLTATILAVLF